MAMTGKHAIHKRIKEDLIEFSGQHVSTGKIGSYIVKLYKEEGFRHLGYSFYNKDGCPRFVIHTLYPAPTYMKQYFNDRCPAMIENECRNMTGIPHKIVTWENGFDEVQG